MRGAVSMALAYNEVGATYSLRVDSSLLFFKTELMASLVI